MQEKVVAVVPAAAALAMTFTSTARASGRARATAHGNDSGARELWAQGANMLGVCTQATGQVFGSGFSYSGHSDERC